MIFICRAARPRACATISWRSTRRSRSAERCFPRTPMCTLTDRGDGTSQLDAAARLSANIERFNLATATPLPQAISRLARAAPGETQPGIDRQRPCRRRAPARHDRLRCLARRPARDGGAVGLLVGQRECRLGRRSRLRCGLASGRARISHIRALRQHGDRADRRSRDRRFARVRRQPQLLARSEARLRHVAAAARAGRRGPRARLSRPQRQWRARSGRAARKGRAGDHRHQAGRPADRRQRLGHRRRPQRITSRSRSESTKPASPTRCWCRRRRCRWWCRGPAFRPKSRSAWSAAATSRARSSRAAASASKGSTSNWSTRPARSSATARTDYDGFFLFERVAYGNYTIRVAKESAAAAKIARRSRRPHRGHARQVGRRGLGAIRAGADRSRGRSRPIRESDGPIEPGRHARHVADVLVRSRRLELPRPFGHSDLNAARLPVPPRPHVMK